MNDPLTLLPEGAANHPPLNPAISLSEETRTITLYTLKLGEGTLYIRIIDHINITLPTP